MNRNIKFRAWNTNNNKMYSPEELEKDQLTLTVIGKFINIDSNRKENSEIYDHILPLQFTGLKDKNDKEIYEGDIVKNSYNSEYLITFKDGAFRMNEIILYFYYKEVEVIGNIYETSTTSQIN